MSVCLMQPLWPFHCRSQPPYTPTALSSLSVETANEETRQATQAELRASEEETEMTATAEQRPGQTEEGKTMLEVCKETLQLELTATQTAPI
jgi:hypothetical protein